MKHVVRSIGVISVAKIAGLVYGCLGLLLVPFFLLAGFLGAFADKGNNPLAGAVGIALAILAPVLYGIMGFITGAISALLYNLFAKLVGGFELELDMQPATPMGPYPLVPPGTPGI